VIYKELDPLEGEATQQMANFLRSAFDASEEVDVLNGLVVRSGGLLAQMDHLVLHPYGLLLIENVSVLGTIQIEADWQWTHNQNGHARPMRSPITEIKLQALSLEAFLDKKVKQKTFFHSLELDVLVAVQDAQSIKWPAGGVFPEVCNADLVPERVRERVGQCRREARKPGVLTLEQRQRLAVFLKASHKPVPRLGPESRASGLGE
jgi:hypothetical protein